MEAERGIPLDALVERLQGLLALADPGVGLANQAECILVEAQVDRHSLPRRDSQVTFQRQVNSIRC